jgi:hypothetical protein
MRVEKQLLETLEAVRVGREDVLQTLEPDSWDRADIFRISLFVYCGHASIVCVDHLVVNANYPCLVLVMQERTRTRLTTVGEDMAVVDNPHGRTRLIYRVDLLHEVMEHVHGDMLS